MKNRMQDLDFEQNVAFDKVQEYEFTRRGLGMEQGPGSKRKSRVSRLFFIKREFAGRPVFGD